MSQHLFHDNQGVKMKMLQIKHNFFINIIIFFWISTSFGKATYDIGLCIMATGKYIQFVEPLIESARKYFVLNHTITFFVFTDGDFKESKNVMRMEQKKLGWPYDTMMRFAVYFKHHKLLSKMDYLFSCDADMLFVDYEGNEILGRRVATQHPGHNGKYAIFAGPKTLSYDNNPISTAYIAPHEGTHYFAGGFYGGTVKEFFRMAKKIIKNIEKDLANNNYIARHHDESHLNRYFIDHPPLIILDRSSCYPEHGFEIGYPPCKPKLLALDKNHDEIRE